jgi:hypothetical protein
MWDALVASDDVQRTHHFRASEVYRVWLHGARRWRQVGTGESPAPRDRDAVSGVWQHGRPHAVTSLLYQEGRGSFDPVYTQSVRHAPAPKTGR